MSKNEILIPQHISKIAVRYSVPIILFASFVSFYTNHIILAYLQYIVYLTSRVHWNCVYNSGIVRHIDIFFAVATLLYATFVTCNYIEPGKVATWCTSLQICLSVFVINETTLRVGLRITTDKNELDQIFYYNTFMHMAFIHYGLSLSCIYCIL